MAGDPSLTNLLRMLEPVTRPDGLGAARPPALPIEARDFDSLLSEAVARGSADTPPHDAAAAAAGHGPLASLGSMDRIENASLRDLLTRADPPGRDPIPSGGTR